MIPKIIHYTWFSDDPYPEKIKECMKSWKIHMPDYQFIHWDMEKIKDIKVMKRGASGKAMEVELMTNKGCYRIYKELVIRRVFQKNGVSLPSANIIIDNKMTMQSSKNSRNR